MYVYYILPLCLGSQPCVQIYVLLKYFPHTSEYSKFFCRSFIELTVVEERILKICNVSLQYISKYSSNSPHVLKCCVCNTGASYPPLDVQDAPYLQNLHPILIQSRHVTHVTHVTHISCVLNLFLP